MRHANNTHECIFEYHWDTMTVRPTYTIRCRCHQDSWQLKYPTDETYVCPTSGIVGPRPLPGETERI